ncbi:snapalysin family zinc-dependent metalloprotease [Pilimelia terevasa]|nr:snapalysin family zinc-dependent metalloprotease [Pilimelia terevasa]
MLRRTAIRALVAAGVVGAGLAAPHAAGAATPAATAAVRVVTYDASRASQYREGLAEAARIWNAKVPEIEVREGSPAAITIVAENGWPSASPSGFGRGRIVMGKEAVDLGHHVPRIAAHEMGHIFGLPDDRTGRCTDLMSGSSAPATCRNAEPNPQEAAKVRRNAGGSGGPAPRL